MTHLEPIPGETSDPVPAAAPHTAPDTPTTIEVTALGEHTLTARPVLPAWVRSRSDFAAVCRWLRRYAGQAALFHTVRSPAYAGRLVWRVPRGCWRAIRWAADWVFDAEAAPARHDPVRRNQVGEYLALSRQRNDRVRRRGVVALAGAVVLAVGGWLVVAFVPVELQAAALVTVVGLLGKLGTPADRRVIDPVSTVPFAPPRLEPTSVIRALRSLGISAMNTKGARYWRTHDR